VADPIVLVVDDRETDALLMRIVLERAGFVKPPLFAVNGEEAIAHLEGTGVYSDRKRFPMPNVVLLDLNMPKKNGFEVLAWIRQQPALKQLPVYVLSASSRAVDIRRAHELGANTYLVKPTNLDGLIHMAKSMAAWLGLSHVAPESEVVDDVHFTAAPENKTEVPPVRGPA
jgi:CheY-like chemotaxis protein